MNLRKICRQKWNNIQWRVSLSWILLSIYLILYYCSTQLSVQYCGVLYRSLCDSTVKKMIEMIVISIQFFIYTGLQYVISSFIYNSNKVIKKHFVGLQSKLIKFLLFLFKNVGRIICTIESAHITLLSNSVPAEATGPV